MENRYESLINEFERNFKRLIAERKTDREENETLKAELERKQEDLMKAHKEVLDLRSELNLLLTADGLSGSSDNREHSRKHLTKIVQEIDKCLALLNE